MFQRLLHHDPHAFAIGAAAALVALAAVALLAASAGAASPNTAPVLASLAP